MAKLMNKSGIKPAGGYVVIELPDAQEKVGSIFIPQSEAEKQQYGTQRGTVVAIGPMVGKTLSGVSNGHEVAVGDDVAFARYAGTMIKGVDGKDYRLLLDDDVKGVFDAAV